MLSKYNTLVREVTENLEKFELGMAVQKLYDFIWDILCDWYIELCKTRLQAGGETSLAAQQVLCYVMEGTLRLLHPFMPFITEEIWQALPHQGESIMVAPWPVYREELNFAQEEASFEKVMQAIRAIRARRGEMPAETTAAFTVGQALYWDDTNHWLTATAGSAPAKPLAGWATEPKTASAAVARVRLGG